MSSSPYRTIGRAAQAELIISKSRFICLAKPVVSQEEALSHLQDVKGAHRQASHHCYAYIIGVNAGIMRYQDDGEPGGTAGLPILGVLQSQHLVNLCVVVVRYFGGILLGSGGLVRAYTKACTLGVDEAGVVIMEPSVRISVSLPYPLWDRVQKHLSTLPIVNMNTEYDHEVSHSFVMRESDDAAIRQSLRDASDGRAIFGEAESLFYPWQAEVSSA